MNSGSIDASAHSQRFFTPLQLGEGKAPKILVVDDLKINRELFREALEMRGYDVADACDGAQGIEQACKGIPDLILLDIEMPVLDGFAVAKHLRKDSRFTDIPIIAITALNSREDRERALDAGFSSLLPKPFTLSELIREVECFLGLDWRELQPHCA